MKLVQFTYIGHNDIRAGYIDGHNVVEINPNPLTSTTMLEVLNRGYKDIKDFKCNNPALIPLNTVTLKAPITGMDKVLCIGLNYKDHCAEQNFTPPPNPIIFNKFQSMVIGPNEPVKVRLDVTKKVDWETELAVVIGKTANYVKAENAYDYILGYTVAQDITARDWQDKNGGQYLLCKAMDTFCPIGPCITTVDAIKEPHNLDIKCTINGVVKQMSNTKNIIHRIPDVIERLTSVMTLLPGDILLTGTPAGVGVHRDPPEFLKPGDYIQSEIQNIGILETIIEKF